MESKNPTSWLPRGTVSDPKAFAMVMEGDYWGPSIMPGDRIIMSPAATAADGQLVLVRFTGYGRTWFDVRRLYRFRGRNVFLPPPGSTPLLAKAVDFYPIVQVRVGAASKSARVKRAPLVATGPRPLTQLRVEHDWADFDPDRNFDGDVATAA